MVLKAPRYRLLVHVPGLFSKNPSVSLPRSVPWVYGHGLRLTAFEIATNTRLAPGLQVGGIHTGAYTGQGERNSKVLRKGGMAIANSHAIQRVRCGTGVGLHPVRCVRSPSSGTVVGGVPHSHMFTASDSALLSAWSSIG